MQHIEMDTESLGLAVRNNQRLTYEQLRDEVASAVADYAESQAALARELDVTRGAVNRAVKEAGPMLVRLQKRIIEHLTEYHIEDTFTVRRKE